MNSTKAKKFNGKKLFKINALVLPSYKDHFKAKKIQRKWTQNELSNL
jgi:hypothetical protein